MDFKPEYVRCTWSPELEGKEVCYSDSIDEIWKEVVNSKDRRTRCEKGRNVKYPFRCGSENWRFVYYDPNYSAKIAQEQGKKIECKRKGDVWKDWDYIPDPEWLEDYEYRIMQEEEENPVTNRELSLWMAHGNGELYYCIDEDRRAKYFTGFQRYPDVIRRPPTCFTEFPYHPDEGDKQVCNVMVRKWEDTEWHTPTREYMGLEE